MDLTHASFFSGVGGLDLGLERAGWRTVSFSEIDPYASAVLAQRWPGVPNLGDILDLGAGLVERGTGDSAGRRWRDGAGFPPAAATLWTGGFPCQDLSVAGKRRGMGAGTRSGLAYAFLDLVAVHRPRAVLLENVPGLLSSHGGRDMAALLGALVELGYGVGYRVLDARHFGVPQRRRRVFILGITPSGRVGAERAAEVLSVGSRCRWHPPAGVEAGPDAAAGTRPGIEIARAVTGTSGKRHDDDTDTLIANALSASDGHHGHSSPRGDGSDNLIIGASPDAGRVRAPDGLAGRLDGGGGVVQSLDTKRGGADDNEAQAGHLVVSTSGQGWWNEGPGTLQADAGGMEQGGHLVLRRPSLHRADEDGMPMQRVDDLLPPGLDSHRYRCCGNGVVAPVAEWIGRRLAEALT